MIYLSGAVRAEVLRESQMGVIITPDMGNMPDLTGCIWAADNGCFSQGERFKLWRYMQFLEERMAASRSSCLFATAPDVLCDHKATWRRSAPVLPIIRSLGYPAAFVAQDGIQHHLHELDWDAFDWLFVGGGTTWKLSQATRRTIEAARAHGKRVHMGRVNSFQRLQRAALWGCETVDGTYLKFGPDVNLPKLRHWLERINQQPELLSA